MAARTYPERVIVLRKTRLREADLILTMLAEDGERDPPVPPLIYAISYPMFELFRSARSERKR